MKYYFTLSLCCALFTACSPKQAPESAPAVPPASTAPQAEKPGAPITLLSPSLLTIAPGQEELTELQIAAESPKGVMSINISSDEGLQLIESTTEKEIDLPLEKPVTIPVRLLAVTPGRFYLHLQTSIDDGDSVTARDLAVIVQVNAVSSSASSVATSPTLKKPSQNKVVSMPAKETISNH